MPGGGPPGNEGGIIIGSRILMKRERTTGSGGCEYIAGNITSVLLYNTLKVGVDFVPFPAFSADR